MCAPFGKGLGGLGGLGGTLLRFCDLQSREVYKIQIERLLRGRPRRQLVKLKCAVLKHALRSICDAKGCLQRIDLLPDRRIRAAGELLLMLDRLDQRASGKKQPGPASCGARSKSQE